MSKLTRQVLSTLFAIAGTALLLYGLYMVRSIIFFIIVSAVLGLIGKPLTYLLQGGRWPWLKLNRNLAAAITLVIMISVLAGVLSAFIPALISELKVLSHIDYQEVFDLVSDEVRDWRELIGNKAPSPELESDWSLSDSLANAIDFSNISDTLSGFLGSLGTVVYAIFSILFITFFFLRENDLFKNIMIALVPNPYEENLRHVMPGVKRNLTRYFTGLLIQITIITTLVSIGLKLIGFHNTIVIGFFTGLVNVIPYLGPIIGMAFGLVLGIATNYSEPGSTDLFILIISIIAVFGTVQMIDNFFIQPIIFSTSINAHPLEIFIVISVVGTLAGIPGMIVAVPGYSVLRLAAFEFFPDWKVVRYLNAQKEESAPPQS